MNSTFVRCSLASLFFLVAQPTWADDVELDDILGRWCSDTSTYTFSRTQLAVTLNSGQRPKHGPVLKIAGVTADGDHINVQWMPVKPGNSTDFELSENRRELVQQAQTKGDKGPRRVFRRC
jgi:hypothetical protein